MSIALLTITHERIGEDIFGTACQILGPSRVPVRHFRFASEDAPEKLEADILAAVAELDEGSGVLVLSDLFGATPCNIARRLTRAHNVHVLSGLNLPMMLRVLQYANRDMSLDELAARAEDAGRIGVVACRPEQPD